MDPVEEELVQLELRSPASPHGRFAELTRPPPTSAMRQQMQRDAS